MATSRPSARPLSPRKASPSTPGPGGSTGPTNGDPGVNSGGTSYANLDGSGGGPFKTGAATVSNPNFVALLETPLAAGAPTVTVGSSDATVSCSPGQWAPDEVASFLYRAPHTFSYRWSLDGIDIPGATASTYAPAVAGEYAAA